MSQVSEFNVANASGASVRAEINSILDAIRKRKLPNLSRNAQVITLIHGEAERLNVSLDDAEEQETKEAIELSKQLTIVQYQIYN